MEQDVGALGDLFRVEKLTRNVTDMVTWSIGRKEKSARNGYNIKTATRPCGYGVRIGEGSALVDQPADDIDAFAVAA